MDVPAIIAEIRRRLEEIPKSLRPGRSDATWTIEVKKQIGSLGEQRKNCHGEDEYCVAANGVAGCFGGKEWLYDLVWFKNAPVCDMPWLRELFLVMESEWSTHPHDIFDDFEKLFIARATIKVMIFQDGSGTTISALMDAMEQGLGVYRDSVPSEVYLLAGFDNHAFRFEFRTIPRELSSVTACSVS